MNVFEKMTYNHGIFIREGGHGMRSYAVGARAGDASMYTYIYIYSYVKYIIYIQNKKLSLYLSLLYIYIYIYIYIYMAWVSPAECICVFFHLFRWPAGNAQQRSVLKSLIFYIFAKIPPPRPTFSKNTLAKGMRMLFWSPNVRPGAWGA